MLTHSTSMENKIVTLKNQTGLTAVFSTLGATWLSCQVNLTQYGNREILLGCQDLHQHNGSYMGMTIGRYANRISNASISNNNKCYQLEANYGQHQLHGGDSFNEQNWTIILQQENRVIFAITSPNGEKGFPGEVNVTVDYLLNNDNQLLITYLATTTEATPINLTNHAYFNLDGVGDARNQILSVNSDYYLPVDNEGIPNEQLQQVEHRKMDLRSPVKLLDTFFDSDDRIIARGYDHAYLLNESAQNMSKPAATLISADQLIKMNVWTNKPAIQIYSGNHLQGIKSRDGTIYNDYAGIALETEFLPDSPNHHDYPHESCWFKPNEFYCYSTNYEFIFNNKNEKGKIEHDK